MEKYSHSQVQDILLAHDIWQNKHKESTPEKILPLAIIQLVLCTFSTEETILHLIWDCPFALQAWDFIAPNRKRGISVMEHIHLTQYCLPKEIATEIIIMSCWHIWMQRDNWIFKGMAPSIHSWKRGLKKDMQLIKHNILNKYETVLTHWIDSNLNDIRS